MRTGARTGARARTQCRPRTCFAVRPARLVGVEHGRRPRGPRTPGRRPGTVPRRVHGAPPGGDRRGRRHLVGRRRGDADRRRRRRDPRDGRCREGPRRAPPRGDRGRGARTARRPPRGAGRRLGASCGGRGPAGRRPRGRRQRDRQDHDDRQARNALRGRGPLGDPGRRRHVPGGGHRPAPDLGRARRRSGRGPRPGSRPRRRGL